MTYQPIARWKQSLGGALIGIVGAIGTAWIWHDALTEGYFYFKASMLLPAFAVLGLGLVIFPGYKEERIAAGEDISALSEFRLATPRWRPSLVSCLVPGMAISPRLRWA